MELEKELPMNLQFFAEGAESDPELNTGEGENNATEPNTSNGEPNTSQGKPSEGEGETDTTVEKLQKRLHSETANKHSLEQQVAELKKQLEDKANEHEPTSVKKMSEDEKNQKALEELNKKNAELEAKLKRNEVLSQTRSVFQEDGINVEDNILDLIVTDDEKKTYKNIVAIKSLINSTTEAARKGFLQGSTPKDTGSSVADAFTKKLNKYK